MILDLDVISVPYVMTAKFRSDSCWFKLPTVLLIKSIVGSISIAQYFALNKVSTLYAGPLILKSPTNCMIKGGNNEKANTADQEVVVIGPYSASNQCNRKSSEKCFRYLCLVNDNDKFHFISFVRR